MHGRGSEQQSQMQTCTTQHLGDLHLAQSWAERLEALHGISHVVRKLVYGWRTCTSASGPC